MLRFDEKSLSNLPIYFRIYSIRNVLPKQLLIVELVKALLDVNPVRKLTKVTSWTIWVRKVLVKPDAEMNPVLKKTAVMFDQVPQIMLCKFLWGYLQTLNLYNLHLKEQVWMKIKYNLKKKIPWNFSAKKLVKWNESIFGIFFSCSICLKVNS